MLTFCEMTKSCIYLNCDDQIKKTFCCCSPVAHFDTIEIACVFFTDKCLLSPGTLHTFCVCVYCFAFQMLKIIDIYSLFLSLSPQYDDCFPCTQLFFLSLFSRWLYMRGTLLWTARRSECLLFFCMKIYTYLFLAISNRNKSAALWLNE